MSCFPKLFKRLIEKLKNLGSNQFSAKVNHICNLPELPHSDNTQVMFNLDTLNFAITKRRKVSFIFNRYGIDLKLHPRREKPYIVSPYQMAATNGRYYLIAYDEEKNTFSNYRIDKMTDVKILNIPVKPKSELAEFTNGFNLPSHMAEHIYMFSGESIWATFWTTDSMIDALIDWFGKDFKILEKNEDKILIKVKVNEKAIKVWAIQYGDKIEVIQPISLREEIKEQALKIAQNHS